MANWWVSRVNARYAYSRITLLTSDIDGCIHMTDGASQRRAESRASQPRARAAAAVQATAGGSGAVGAGLVHLTTTSLSLLATSAEAEEAGARERSEVGVHRQALSQFDSTSAAVRQREWADDQRSSQSGLACSAVRRARAWLSRGPLRVVLCNWNIASIVYCQKSWLRSTRYWCPTNAGPLAECLPQRRSSAWR